MWLVALAITVFTAFFTAAAWVPVAHGFVRGSEFPRQQLLVMALVGLALLPFLETNALWMGAVLGVVCVIQAVWIARFTPLWPAQAQSVESAGSRPRVRVLSLNVKMSNRRYNETIALIRERSPDLILLVEIDEAWAEAMHHALAAHTHQVIRPFDNGYGILVASRFPLDEIVVEDLLVERVPSVRARVTLPSGFRYRIFAVHPEPPTPHQDSIGRDAEIGLVAKMVAADPLPCVVAGDLNDVGWSSTTRRFQRISGLLDPRVGRGFYNSFHAQFPIFRWPLDHLFHDPGFAVVEVARLPDVGSDHFPMWFELAWTGGAGARPLEEPSPEDQEEVDKLVIAEGARQREPVGEDWERDD